MRSSQSSKWNRRTRGFALIEISVVIAVIAILAALLFPVLARAKQASQQTTCLSKLKQIGYAFTMYLDDHEERFPDRRNLKAGLPDGYHPWTSWPPSDPRAGWAAVVLQSEGANYQVWSCPAAVVPPIGNVPQTAQVLSTNSDAPVGRYWLWRFDRTNDLSAPLC